MILEVLQIMFEVDISMNRKNTASIALPALLPVHTGGIARPRSFSNTSLSSMASYLKKKMRVPAAALPFVSNLPASTHSR